MLFRSSYRELDDFTDLIMRTLQTVPLVSKVTRAGVLKESVYIEYSQERLASYGLQPSKLAELLRARNTKLPGGQLEVQGKTLGINPSGEFKNERESGDVLVTVSPSGSPLYLRDMADISRGYESPPRYLNYYTWQDAGGRWQRSRSITLAVQMRPGEQIAKFGAAVDAALASLKPILPEDLMLARTSDQPLQVEENIGLFTRSLLEAIVLEAIALDGFTMLNDALLRAAKTEDTEAAALAMGERYIEFALSHRGHFRVMFRSDLCHVAESAELQAAADAAFETLVDQARRVVGDEATPDEVQVQATMMWALAHGLATLLIDGSLDRHVGSVRRRRALVHSVLLSSGFG